MALGVHVKKLRYTRSPVPVAAMAPLLSATGADGPVVFIRACNPETPFSSARPAQTEGMAVFAHVGDAAPAELSGFKFVRHVGRGKFTVTFDAALPRGTWVWVTAAYFNGRKQMGPASSPVRARIGMGSTMPVMKMAA